ncbi:hypothetical protein [Cellulomonas fimi]|uniref:hypothetical protein n=1 Tax=Cellulomonas fimi TaxID=1708 RepID=UPI001B8683FC|nr:hypothetical protein [Cellulomonas fimi]
MTAKKLLAEAVKTSGRRSTVQLAEEYARAQKVGQASTPLSELFALGEVPMKLYLTLVMLTRKAPHELFRARPDHYWAEMFGYEELNDAAPEPGAGTRRIRRAFRALSSAGPAGESMVSRTPEPGHGARIAVPIHPPEPSRAPYITIPLELWSRGWINVLSARALFVYLCLRLVLAGKPDSEGAHVSSWDREKFCIKDDTWQRGFKELEGLGLARGAKEDGVPGDRWSTDLHRRKVYYLNNTFLAETNAALRSWGCSPAVRVCGASRGG